MPDNMRDDIIEWEVEMAISGAITIANASLRLHEEKGERNPFMTTVVISQAPQGVYCKLVARAFDQQNANDAAVYFVGQALDVLSLHLDIPLYLNLFQPEFRSLGGHVRRRIRRNEWEESFRLGRQYSLNRRNFSRAMSWYRKGLLSEDPIDRVIAFWSALEAIGSKYFRESERTKQGIINQVCDCFDQLWGTVENWRVIPGDPQIINQLHEFRNGFSHGYMQVDIVTIRKMVENFQIYQKLIHQFLIDWEINGVDIEKSYTNSAEQSAVH